MSLEFKKNKQPSKPEKSSGGENFINQPSQHVKLSEGKGITSLLKGLVAAASLATGDASASAQSDKFINSSPKTEAISQATERLEITKSSFNSLKEELIELKAIQFPRRQTIERINIIESLLKNAVIVPDASETNKGLEINIITGHSQLGQNPAMISKLDKDRVVVDRMLKRTDNRQFFSHLEMAYYKYARGLIELKDNYNGKEVPSFLYYKPAFTGKNSKFWGEKLKRGGQEKVEYGIETVLLPGEEVMPADDDLIVAVQGQRGIMIGILKKGTPLIVEKLPNGGCNILALAECVNPIERFSDPFVGYKAVSLSELIEKLKENPNYMPSRIKDILTEQDKEEFFSGYDHSQVIQLKDYNFTQQKEKEAIKLGVDDVRSVRFEFNPQTKTLDVVRRNLENR